MAERILMIEDDGRLSAMVAEYLSASGYRVVVHGRALDGLAALEAEPFDALVLDVMLPDLDGFEVCRRVRARSAIPVLMLTARGDATDRVVGLELGADDYLPKPFSPKELEARIATILRRVGRGSAGAEPRDVPAGQGALRVGDLVVDTNRRQVKIGRAHV